MSGHVGQIIRADQSVKSRPPRASRPSVAPPPSPQCCPSRLERGPAQHVERGHGHKNDADLGKFDPDVEAEKGHGERAG